MTLLLSLALAALVSAGYFIYTTCQNVFFSVHKAVPGPFWHRASGLPLLLADLAANRTSTIHALHERYGSVVRISPNELSFSGVDDIKSIYGQGSPFMKSSIYDSFGRPGVFSMRNKEVHGNRRKLLSHAFSTTNVNLMEPLIAHNIAKLSTRLSSSVGCSVDALHWFRMLSLDIVGELFLGRPFGALDDDVTPTYAHDLDNFFLVFAIYEAFPMPAKFLRKFGTKKLRNLLGTSDRMYQFGADAFREYVAQYGRSSQQRNLLNKLIEASSIEKGVITDAEIEDEISNLIFAGTDTTSTSLTYLFWELSRNPDIQQKLYNEVQSVGGNEGGQLTAKYRSGLDFLEAVINETLRLHPAAPSSLLRTSPRGGAWVDKIFVPEETIISMQCYTTHRDPAVFPNPDRFDPTRWLGADGPDALMKEAFMPFTKGTRTCLGKNLAVMELKMITGALVRKFKVTTGREMKADDMDMKDKFLLFPKGRMCKLVFEPRA